MALDIPTQVKAHRMVAEYLEAMQRDQIALEQQTQRLHELLALAKGMGREEWAYEISEALKRLAV